MCENAYKLLEKSYKNCLTRVRDSSFYSNYANEKMLHSLQVFGLGKYIYKHEFEGKKTTFFKNLALTAVMLHDIGRFREIESLYNQKAGISEVKNAYDHGVIGYEILKEIQDFSDVRVCIPVKHHGHMISELYKDEEYSSITDDVLKKEIEEIIFLVRDADKMANLYLFVDKADIENSTFYKLNVLEKKTKTKDFKISPKVLEEFMNGRPILNSYSDTVADEVIRCIAWLYDINFKISYKYFMHHKLIDKYIRLLEYFSADKKDVELVKNKINSYIDIRIEKN